MNFSYFAGGVSTWRIIIVFLGFTWRHKFLWGSTLNRCTVIGGKQFFTVCVELVFGSKYMQFREISSLQYSIIIHTCWIDPHSDLLQNASKTQEFVMCSLHQRQIRDEIYLSCAHAIRVICQRLQRTEYTFDLMFIVWFNFYLHGWLFLQNE